MIFRVEVQSQNFICFAFRQTVVDAAVDQTCSEGEHGGSSPSLLFGQVSTFRGEERPNNGRGRQEGHRDGGQGHFQYQDGKGQKRSIHAEEQLESGSPCYW
jgi:hypothetical protein